MVIEFVREMELYWKRTIKIKKIWIKHFLHGFMQFVLQRMKLFKMSHWDWKIWWEWHLVLFDNLFIENYIKLGSPMIKFHKKERRFKKNV